MIRFLLAPLLLSFSTGSSAGPMDETMRAALHGRVVDAQTAEPIAKATVAVPALKIEVATDSSGVFSIAGLPPGDVELVVTTIGYGLARKTVHVGADSLDVEIRVGQEALKRSEEVVVEAPPFDPVDPAAPASHTLRGVELRNLGGVITDDPLRSVQSLPGVTTGDDFYATFATRGSGFSSVGFYLDGVLMSAPFHTILDINDAYSLTILNGDVVESLSLLSGGAPARYGDRTGAVLDVRTREGNRDEFSGRASLGAAGVYGTVEGPLGHGRSTSWLLSARKSYLDYILDRIDVESGTVIGYYDVTGRLAHHPTPSQTLGLTLLHGRSKWRTGDQTDPLQAESARAGSDLAVLQWRHDAPVRRLGLDAFVVRETGRRVDGPTEASRSTSDQWGLRTDLARTAGAHRLEGGALVRRLGDRATAQVFDSRLQASRVTEDYTASGVQWGGYLQDTWTGLGRRLSVTVGGRFDRWEETGESHLLPRASGSVSIGPNTRVMAAFGDYAQFPSFADLFGRQGNPDLEAERSRHFTLAVERRLGERTRLRVEAYDQEEDRLLFAPGSEWRVAGGRVVVPRPDAIWRNVLTGRSQGVEVLVQRRSANGLSGWAAYSYGHARRRDESSGLEFDSDFDQRHTVTLYSSLRLTETWNFSVKYRYGSAFPIPGFYAGDPRGIVLLSDERNRLRPQSYGRLDLRANKAWLFRAWKLTLFGEVLNVLDRDNARYFFDGVDPRTRRVFLSSGSLFPIVPAVGITIDF
jgi:carboxypeptidase-like protein/TonB-dependent receptor-like protein